MSQVHITETSMFAIEMTRAVFAQEPFLEGIDLGDLWERVDVRTRMTMLGQRFNVRVELRNSNNYIEASGSLDTDGDGWNRGQCSVTAGDGKFVTFDCVLRDGKFVVTPM